ALPTWATVRSTVLVNSSKTMRLSASASNLASVTRNCCPVERTWNGRSQAGGEEKPTDDSRATTSLTGRLLGKASRTERSLGQVRASCQRTADGQRRRAMVDLPHPEGPVIRPIDQGRSSSGRETSQVKREVFSGARSNMPWICCTRGDRTTGDSTVMVACMGPSCRRTSCQLVPGRSRTSKLLVLRGNGTVNSTGLYTSALPA